MKTRPMTDGLLNAFKVQLYYQCQFVLIEKARIDFALQQKNVTLVFAALQSLLIAAANISKTCWGSNGYKYTERRRTLREEIGISDSSSLKDVTMRNKFDHFDEGLELWWKKSTSHNLIDMNIGSISPQTDRVDVFRTYDPISGIAILNRYEVAVQDIVGEVTKILPKLSEAVFGASRTRATTT